MANSKSGSIGSSSLSDELDSLSAGTIWKGENESDAEMMEGCDSVLSDAGAWTKEEACALYREKLVRLRDLYVGQLDHLRYTLKEKRRQFLLQWQYESRRRDAEMPQENSLQLNNETAAYQSYRRKSGEEALLNYKLKRKRLAASLDYFFKKESSRDTQKSHYQYLLKQHHRLYQPPHHCNNNGCDNRCLPFSSKCSRHICDDSKQLLYIKCSYIYPSGNQCTNPIPKYLNPLFCGGHCDNIKPPESSTEEDIPATGETTVGVTVIGKHTNESPPTQASVSDELTSTSVEDSLKDTNNFAEVDSKHPDGS